MCLAVPMKILSLDGMTATVEVSGIKKSVRIDLLPQATVGNYVLVHAGLAISIVDESEAKETLELLEQLTDNETH